MRRLVIVATSGPKRWKGFRLEARAMEEEFDKSDPVLHLLLRYTQALMTQMSQTAVCNRHHSLDL